jgi:hypothetical protein
MAIADTERLRLALTAAPGWFQVHAASALRATGAVSLELNAAGEPWVVLLEILLQPSGIRVRELAPGTQFPARCPERHIEDSGWFCLGLSSGMTITDDRSAEGWWDNVRSFLRMQRVAARTGLWPDHHALSHGTAGVHHLRALELAAEVGLAGDYEALLAGEPSVLERLLPLLAKREPRLINGRAPCLCGCRRNEAAILRRNCPNRGKIVGLLLAERERKKALSEFWNEMRRVNVPCCGKMAACPLRPV